MRQRDGSSFGGHHVQVYFKTEAVPMEQGALSEAARVLQFQHRIQTEGVFTGSYDAGSDLGGIIIPNIQRAIEVYMSSPRGSAMVPTPDAPRERTESRSQDEARRDSQEDEGEPPGILDLVVSFHTKIALVNTRMNVFSDEVHSLATAVADVTPALQLEEPEKQRQMVNGLADRMLSAATRIADSLGGGEDELQMGIRDMISAVQQELESPLAAETSEKAIAEMLESMQYAINQIDTLHKSVAEGMHLDAVPDLTAKLRRAKRLLTASFESFDAFLLSTLEIMVGAQIEVNQIIAERLRGSSKPEPE
jgi:hypothetical protein